ncbi:methyltransferase domain-containing protein [Conexibacter sp. W3-3-2]|uniref:Class I SAM-dependent methyltransferase n=1 Tax=Paraconexibacter algicola TaxID=2133960 RepID=A0A2T4UMD1_9ACTN|nr:MULTISPECIES: class I SAM-dependent methyltransferase [Solirubrobacterales]MTD46674.1 methyltransferase domain-containing protein [Conexibacter sp. W3-3-2]PTL60395.1 class I SAM-dependent methyltransferase [Paraconexibacter algicola]
MILDRLFAAGYDVIFQRAERGGLTAMRAEAIGDLSGTVVELGAGTGLNLAHYPAAVDRLIATEPDPHMVKRLRAKVAAGEGGGPERVTVAQAGGERLPLQDGEADAIVCTLVLCTAPDVPGVLAEAVRVLKPGGRFRFVEHVRADGHRHAAWQDRLNRPWGALAGGCNANRDTLAALRAAPGLEVRGVRDDSFPGVPALVRPLIRGEAVRV